MTSIPHDARKVSRDAIFISHATPEDNAFTIWLGAKLTAMGYEVWADVLRLKGGEQWPSKIENALRNSSCKMLLVANSNSIQKPGVRKEIKIAREVSHKINDPAFIIPLHMEKFQAPSSIASAHYIDFSHRWACGLKELLDTLQETYRIPRKSNVNDALWREIQMINGKKLISRPELLISNWLSIDEIPQTIHYYEYMGYTEGRYREIVMKDSIWPTIALHSGFISFVDIQDVQSISNLNLPVKCTAKRSTSEFLDRGWPVLDLNQYMARNHFSDLTRQAFEKFFKERGFLSYQMSGAQKAWWPPAQVAPSNIIPFRWGNISGKRQIQGISKKRGINWHYGVSVATRSGPVRHVRIASRLLFTKNGTELLSDYKMMHRHRRSFAKAWRNARWRDMQLAFLYWLAKGEGCLTIHFSPKETMVLDLPPISWQSEVSISNEDEESEADEDDPNDDDEWNWLDE